MSDQFDGLRDGKEMGSGWIRMSEAHRHAGMSRTGWRSFFYLRRAELEVSRVGPKVLLISKASIDALLRKIGEEDLGVRGTLLEQPEPVSSGVGVSGAGCADVANQVSGSEVRDV